MILIQLTLLWAEYIMIIELSENCIQEVGGTSAQVRHCKSQILIAVFMHGRFCVNREILNFEGEIHGL